ncbi:MAG: metal-dependent hydrolase, partial [Candidatus Binataceae bacterium]
MDTITHGIAGALIGKGYFSERGGKVATFALTLGAVFPDCDVVADFLSHDPLAIVKYHRGITHSFVGLPFFAAALAWLTRRVARWLGMDSPSWSMLTLIYAISIASHILLDGLTSFGTRMWTPISQRRVAWDWLFIIDFVFTSLVLLPQIVA